MNLERVLAALGYAERGWYVIPLVAGSKRPCIATGRDHMEGASRSPGRIYRWFREEFPDAEVGVVSGAGSGVVVIDRDGPEGVASFAALEADLGVLPAAASSRTPRDDGGSHLFYAHPGPGVRVKSRRIAPGLDVKGDGGLFAAPPTKGRSWLREPNGALPPLPEAWVKRLSGPAPDTRERRCGVHEDVDAGPRPPIEPILERCPWLRHTRDDARTLSEPEWFAMLSIVSRCDNGVALCHEWSRPYDGYSPAETDRKIEHTVGPRTCQDIRAGEGGGYCELCPLGEEEAVRSPIVLGRRVLAAAGEPAAEQPLAEGADSALGGKAGAAVVVRAAASTRPDRAGAPSTVTGASSLPPGRVSRIGKRAASGLGVVVSRVRRLLGRTVVPAPTGPSPETFADGTYWVRAPWGSGSIIVRAGVVESGEPAVQDFVGQRAAEVLGAFAHDRMDA